MMIKLCYRLGNASHKIKQHCLATPQMISLTMQVTRSTISTIPCHVFKKSKLGDTMLPITPFRQGCNFTPTFKNVRRYTEFYHCLHLTLLLSITSHVPANNAKYRRSGRLYSCITIAITKKQSRSQTAFFRFHLWWRKRGQLVDLHSVFCSTDSQILGVVHTTY